MTFMITFPNANDILTDDPMVLDGDHLKGTPHPGACPPRPKHVSQEVQEELRQIRESRIVRYQQLVAAHLPLTMNDE